MVFSTFAIPLIRYSRIVLFHLSSTFAIPFCPQDHFVLFLSFDLHLRYFIQTLII
uniref:Uncharacterized protein n=1 Tax=Picea glauca TaxID=3330 RepID=A0A101M504_PICGL|nr:hypothetical protein ABT39_MTgene848 [Picea glauca]QHR88325.1 hypothetical protein Q903MT_gene2338 [Picea sitchensis]